MSGTAFTVGIPVLNEEAILVPNTERLLHYLDGLGRDYEVHDRLERLDRLDDDARRRSVAPLPARVTFFHLPEKGVGLAFKEFVRRAQPSVPGLRRHGPVGRHRASSRPRSSCSRRTTSSSARRRWGTRTAHALPPPRLRLVPAGDAAAARAHLRRLLDRGEGVPRRRAAPLHRSRERRLVVRARDLLPDEAPWRADHAGAGHVRGLARSRSSTCGTRRSTSTRTWSASGSASARRPPPALTASDLVDEPQTRGLWSAHADRVAAAPPPFQVSRLATSHWVPQAIYTAAELGVADALGDDARSAADLGPCDRRRCRCAPASLLRALVAVEICTVDDAGRFVLTPLGACLPLRLARLHSLVGPARRRPALLGPVGTARRVRPDGSPCRRSTDATRGSSRPDDPSASVTFNQSMVQLTRHIAGAVAVSYDFAGMHTVVDVGGGYGALLPPILKGNPELRGIVSRPAALPRRCARARREGTVCADRTEFVGGDFFTDRLPRADAYLIKSVIHDWDDDRSVALLRNIRAAMDAKARLLVVEPIVPDRPGSSPFDAMRRAHRSQHARRHRWPRAHGGRLSRRDPGRRPARRAHRPDAGRPQHHRNETPVTAPSR